MAQTEELKQEETATQAQSAEFAEAQNLGIKNTDGKVEMLLDINMPITVTLGGTNIPVRQLLQLCPGSVLQLDKLIDEPAELYVQDIKFATGDIVIVDGHFAIRVKEIVGAAPTAPAAGSAETASPQPEAEPTEQQQ